MKKRLMKLAALLMVLVLLPVCALAEAANAPEEQVHTIEKKTYPHLWCYSDKADAETSEGEMNLYFVDGGDIPYVALSEYVDFLANLYSEVKKDDISYEIEITPADESDQYFIVTRPDNESSMIINPGEDSIIFTSYNAFGQKPGSSALVTMKDIPDPVSSNIDIGEIMRLMLDMETEGGEISEEVNAQMAALMTPPDPAAEHSFFVATNKLFNRRGKILTVNLADYSIDIISEGNECYLPFQTMNDILVCPTYIQYVFNGEKVIGAYYGQELIQEAYTAEPADMSEAFAMFNFHELCFFMDFFYGLKEEHHIDNFTDYLMVDAGLFADMTSTKAVDFDSALAGLLLQDIDDGHSSVNLFSWRCGQDNGLMMLSMMAQMGYSLTDNGKITGIMGQARTAAYPDGVPGYEEIGDTAFVTFDHFEFNRSPEEYYELEDPDNPQDTAELILYAHRQVTRPDSPIKNIVLDLSLNGGGNSDAAIVVASWFTGEARIALRDPNTGAETIAAYRTDLNLNGVTLSNPDGGAERYDPGDSVSGGNYRLFCLTSPVSFSCGNLVPAMFEQARNVTLIGQRTGGGSNAVLPATSASGTLFQMSGNLQIATVRNGAFYNVDTGIEPHVRLNYPESFYDREGLVELIHNLK